ncbi:hypothetical protein GCM10009760_10750 [Kitasatospora kazusensis]|uniref:Alanine and proline-rich secreted protein Apa n=1 Tax=Kitasatospora kazusensis TaxID=407974 RepID=A0ABP5KPE8_9ACTN
MTTEPAESAEPSELSEPAEPTEAAGPVDPVDPVGPAVPRRPRTVRLLVAAVLLGPLLGGGVGYAIQAGRAQTPLPSLRVSAPKYTATVLDGKGSVDAGPQPLSIDGDLRKLLISKPVDADDMNDDFGDASGWASAGDVAMTYSSADTRFRQMLRNGFRRDAIVAWKKNDTIYRVELVQYDAAHVSTAISSVPGTPSTTAHPLPGTVNGVYDAPTTPNTYSDTHEQYYSGRAVARRGDVLMWITVHSPNQVNADDVKDIAERQWERLV